MKAGQSIERTPRSTQVLVLLMAFVGLGAWIVSHYERPPVGLAFQGSPTVSSTGFSFVLTNLSKRGIAIELLSPQMRCEAGWVPNLTVCESPLSRLLRPARSGAPAPGGLSATLAPGRSIVAL